MQINISQVDSQKLTRLFYSKLNPAIEIYNKCLKDSGKKRVLSSTLLINVILLLNF